MKAKLKSRSNRKIWTEKDNQYMFEFYPHIPTKDIAVHLSRSEKSIYGQAFNLGLKKTADLIEKQLQDQAERLKIDGKANRFQKGFTPPNKGEKMPDEIFNILRPTMFSKGNIPHNAKPDYYESIRYDKNSDTSYIYIKIPDVSKMVLKHRFVYEQEKGPIKKGMRIIFLDGNQLNCSIENLKAISAEELIAQNTIHKYPEELKQTIKLLGKLKRKIDAQQ